MKILLGVDGSDDVRAALDYVLRGPRRPEDRLTVITVAQPGLLSGAALSGKDTPPAWA